MGRVGRPFAMSSPRNASARLSHTPPPHATRRFRLPAARGGPLLRSGSRYRAACVTRGMAVSLNMLGRIAVLAAALALAAAPAGAKVLTFHANLDGVSGPAPTG